MTCPPCPPKVDWQCCWATEKFVQYEGGVMSFCWNSLIPSSSNQTLMSTSSTNPPSNPLVPTTATGHINSPPPLTSNPHPTPANVLDPSSPAAEFDVLLMHAPDNPDSMPFDLEKFFSDILWDYYTGSPAVFSDSMLSPIPAPSPIALGSGPPFSLTLASTSEELRDPAYVVPLYMVF